MYAPPAIKRLRFWSTSAHVNQATNCSSEAMIDLLAIHGDEFIRLREPSVGGMYCHFGKRYEPRSLLITFLSAFSSRNRRSNAFLNESWFFQLLKSPRWAKSGR